MYKLQIKITKDILERSKMCPMDSTVSSNCAVALAVRDIFPEASITSRYITPFLGASIRLPEKASNFIYEFDMLSYSPEQRLKLPEMEFEIDIPDSIINQIDISNIYENHPTLKLVEV